MPWQTWDLVRGGMLHVAMWCSSVIAHRATTVAHQPVSAIEPHHVTVVMPLHHGIAVLHLHHVIAATQHLQGIKPGEAPPQEGGDKETFLYLIKMI